jgi:hypothetical protein
MKRNFILSMVISFGMICSCQKQDSAAEQQLAQRKTELDAREEALIAREKVTDEREKALAKRENASRNARTMPSGIQGQIPDPEQLKAERDSRLQQLPPELRTLVPPPSKGTAGDPSRRERPAPRQLGPEDLQRQWQLKSNKEKMSGEAVSPAPEVSSPTPSPAVEISSPTPSLTPP